MGFKVSATAWVSGRPTLVLDRLRGCGCGCGRLTVTPAIAFPIVTGSSVGSVGSVGTLNPGASGEVS